MSRTAIRLGFLPLTDCAPLAVAREMGFAAEEGVDLDLTRAPSWTMVRDRLAMGADDAAHMLAPVPVAMALGLGPVGASLEVLSVLSVNGTVIGASRSLGARLRDMGLVFGDVMGARAAILGAGPLRIGVPFGFSMHRELVHRWLGSTEEIGLTTVPPPMMAEALARGEIDAFCVGEPWGSVAVDEGVGELILPGAAIWGFAPEKVLATRTGWADANPDAARALVRALWRAGQWLADDGSRTTAVEILSRPDYLGRPAELIERAMTGHLTITPDGAGRHVPDFVNFYDGATTFPWRSQAAWIGHRLAGRFGLDPKASADLAKATFRSDLHRVYLDGTGAALPSASSRVEGAIAVPTAIPTSGGTLTLSPDAFFDGVSFDPDA
ncbi:MAG: CmpA/NrtA family ABC transporter substrate-binding protein [Pseudomonadota bacterium]